jgi:hypothetical protein
MQTTFAIGKSSIKTITRKNFGRVPTSPTLLLVRSLRAINVVK